MTGYEHITTGLGEECGVFGAYDMDGRDVAASIYYGLFALQHRGQESCGIAVTDTFGQRKVLSRKGLGLVNEVFDEEELAKLKGNLGVGHVRYSTAGGTRVENAQPLVINYVKGTLAIAHNGNLVNAVELRHELEYTGAIFQTTIDSEVIAYHIARERLNTRTAEDAVKNAMKKIRGAYALGSVRPEAALYREKREHLFPGIRELCHRGRGCGVHKGCAARGDRDDHKGRDRFGYEYGAPGGTACEMQSYPVEADLVVGVPDSGLVAAKGYSERSGIPYGMAFHKNSYVGRTFIKPKQSDRESSVKIKLNVIPEVVRGKRIVMVDDSIVRGTTCANIIKMLKNAGATEVHVRISSPPVLHPCYFGTDVPSDEQLIAHSHTPEEIRKMIGADSLGYMEVAKLKDMVGDLRYCDACFTGDYPMEVPGRDISHAFEQM